MNMPLANKDKRCVDAEYLGDGLYVRFDGYQIWLTWENGIDVLDAVALEPRVLFAFEDYLKRMRAKAATAKPKCDHEHGEADGAGYSWCKKCGVSI